MKFKGSSLMEVLVAMCVCAVCLAISTLIYTNIQKSSRTVRRLKATEIAKQHMAETQRKHIYIDNTASFQEFQVKQTFMPHPDFADCFIIKVVVSDINRTALAELVGIQRIK